MRWTRTGGLARTRPATCTRLEALIDAQEAAVRKQDRDGFVGLCVSFHRAFVEVGGNGLLLDFADRLQNRQAMMLHLSLASIDAHAAQLVDEHRALIDAARRGDFDRFADLLHAHMSDDPSPRFGLA